MLKKLTLLTGALVACTMAAQAQCIDTLNFQSFNSSPTIYTTSSGTPPTYAGYLAGTNGYGDKAKVNLFPSTGTKAVRGVIMAFAVATSGSGSANVNVRVWDATGAAGGPGAALGTVSLPLSDIVQNIADTAFTYVTFPSPITVTGNYYVGFEIPASSAAGDTVAIYNTTSPDASPYAGWELWSDNTWHSYSSAWGSATNPFSSTNLILPIVDNCVTGISEALSNNVLVYPNPASSKLAVAMPGLNATSVVITNAIGQVVKQIVPTNELLSVDVADLSSGVYYVQISNIDGSITKKVNIQN